MASFFDYTYSIPSTVAMDEEKEKMVLIRKVFTIDPKMQKELGREEKEEEPKEQKDDGGKAEDSALYIGGIAMDLSPRHSKTPSSECRAKDKRYCPYHGADFMTEELNASFKKAGIYATGGIERQGNGKFRLQYSVPESKKAAATDIIDSYLSSPGFKEVSESESDDVDSIAKEIKMDRGNDDFAMKEEHLDTLEKDMKNGAEIDPSELYQLRKDHMELKKLSKTAHEAMERDGVNIRTKEGKEWAKTNEDWKKYHDATEKFEKDYNLIRGNADLSHIKTPADCTELMGHLEKQITQVGDFVKATDEIEEMKAKKGLKGKKGIAGTTEYNDAKGSIRFAIDGLKSARKQVAEANESGDIRKMRAAAHSLEGVLQQVGEKKDEIANALKQAESYKKVLAGYPDIDGGDDSTTKPEEKKEKPSSEEKKPASEEKTTSSKEAEKKDDGDKSSPFTDKVHEFLGSRKELEGTAVMAMADGSIVLNRTDNFKGEGKDVEKIAKDLGDYVDMDAKSETVAGYPGDPTPATFIRLTPKKKEEPKSEKKDETKKEEPKSESKADEDGMTDDIYNDMLAKFNEKHHTDCRYPHEMKSLMEAARKGTIDLSAPGGGKYSNDMQFLDDIVAAVGTDHPYVKKIDEYIAKIKDKDSSKKEMEELEKKAKEEIAESTRKMKERSDKLTSTEAAKKYIEELGKKGDSSHKASHEVDKERFEKRFGEERFRSIAQKAKWAKEAGSPLTGKTGWEGEDEGSKKLDSIRSLIKKLGGTVEEGVYADAGKKEIKFNISPDRAHELYGKLDARGGILPNW